MLPNITMFHMLAIAGMHLQVVVQYKDPLTPASTHS